MGSRGVHYLILGKGPPKRSLGPRRTYARGKEGRQRVITPRLDGACSPPGSSDSLFLEATALDGREQPARAREEGASLGLVARRALAAEGVELREPLG